MEDRCVIDYHRLEALKSLLDLHYGVNLSRAYVRAVFDGTEVVEEIRTYGIDDPIVLANAELTLAKKLGISPERIDAETLEAAEKEFQS